MPIGNVSRSFDYSDRVTRDRKLTRYEIFLLTDIKVSINLPFVGTYATPRIRAIGTG